MNTKQKKKQEKVFDYIKEHIKKDMFNGYYIEDYYEKEENLIYFTIGYDEEKIKYELFCTHDKVYITPRERYYDHKDIAFIIYPISELMLEI